VLLKETYAMTAPSSIDPARFLHEQLASASPDLLRSMLTTFVNTLMSAEVDVVCGACYGQSSPERVGPYADSDHSAARELQCADLNSARDRKPTVRRAKQNPEPKHFIRVGRRKERHLAQPLLGTLQSQAVGHHQDGEGMQSAWPDLVGRLAPAGGPGLRLPASRPSRRTPRSMPFASDHYGEAKA
jgi:transposase-like protein